MINLSELPGLFLSIEGPEYSGKTTLLENFVKTTKLDIVTTREPGGTTNAEVIRGMLVNPTGALMHNQQLRAMLFAVARAFHVYDFIMKELENEKIVITDRYIDSSYVLQGIIQNKSLEEINFFNCQANNIGIDINNILPIKTIYIDIVEQTAIERSSKRGIQNLMDEEFAKRFNDIRNGYLELARKNPQRYIVLDGNKSENELLEDFTSTINSIISEFRPKLFK
jgi:dTMP kinase